MLLLVIKDHILRTSMLEQCFSVESNVVPPARGRQHVETFGEGTTGIEWEKAKM